MASYKVDVIQRLGKYHMAFWRATSPKPNPTDSPALNSIDDVVKAVEARLVEGGIEGDKDSVTFRGIAYEDMNQLMWEVRRATY